MNVDWKSPRTIGTLVVVALLAFAISQGMFWSWDEMDYLGWGLLVVVVLIAAAATKFLLTQRKRD